MKRNKGQLSYVIKPISLVMIIVLLLVLYQSIQSVIGKERYARENLDLVSSATNVLLVLANSKDCIAYETETTASLYANVVDISRLDEFVEKYSDVEPECARSYKFGWRVKIVELQRDGSEGKAWEFGAAQFSSGDAFRNSIDSWIPIAIKYSEKDVRQGRMDIKLVDGELESFAGVIDWACQLGKQNRLKKSSVEIHTSYPLYQPLGNGSKLCMETKTPVCRQLTCNVDFEDTKSAGNFILTMNYVDDKLVVRT